MIERIKIENFKSIRELDLELKPINILIGANGAGKSNFISFFKFSNRMCDREKLQEYIGKNIDKFLYFGRKNSDAISGEINFDNNFVFWYLIGAVQNTDDFVNVSTGRFINSQEIGGIFRITQVPTPTEYTGNKVVSTDDEEAYKMSVKYLKTFKIFHFHDTGSSSPMKRINNIDDNDYLREDGANLAAYLYYIQEKHPKDFKKIELQIRSVAPFFDRFNLSPRKLKPEEITLRWFEKGSEDYFDAYDLSDGTLRFMALTTLLMQPNLPKVIIIDEPELGLHPFAINKLAALIRQVAAKGTQVIVATQSVNFVDNFNPEDIIAVDREDNQSVFKRFNSEDLKEWLEDYTLGELWSKNLLGGMP
jgi:predicted ATPase